MPRTPRFDYPGATHHVFNRGACHAPIFHAPEDRDLFLRTLGALPSRFGLRVLAYALMTNHFHLVVATPRANLSAAMQHLLGRYAHLLNARHERDGSPFRGRFANRLVETEDYFRKVLAYVHANPVAAAMVARAIDAPWTSHRAVMGIEPAPEWLDLSWIGPTFGTAAAFGEAVDGWTGELPDLEAPSTEVLETQRAQHVSVTSVADALARVAILSGTSRSNVRHARGRPGQFVAWALASWAGLTHTEIGAILHISRIAVTHRIQRFESWSRNDSTGRAWRGAGAVAA